MDPLTVKPHEAAGWTGAIAALAALLARLLPRRRQLPEGESKRVRELEAENDKLEAQLLDARFQAVEDRLGAKISALEKRLDDVLRENGRQAEQIKKLDKDHDNYFRKLRGEKPKE